MFAITTAIMMKNMSALRPGLALIQKLATVKLLNKMIRLEDKIAAATGMSESSPVLAAALIAGIKVNM